MCEIMTETRGNSLRAADKVYSHSSSELRLPVSAIVPGERGVRLGFTVSLAPSTELLSKISSIHTTRVSLLSSVTVDHFHSFINRFLGQQMSLSKLILFLRN